MRPLTLSHPLPLLEFCNETLLMMQLKVLKDAGASQASILRVGLSYESGGGSGLGGGWPGCVSWLGVGTVRRARNNMNFFPRTRDRHVMILQVIICYYGKHVPASWVEEVERSAPVPVHHCHAPSCC